MTIFKLEKKSRIVNLSFFLSLILLIFSCGGSGKSSDTFVLSGQINGVVQAGITVQVIEENTIIKTTTTDENGLFSFSLTPGIYTIIPSLDDYNIYAELFSAAGWTFLTAISLMLFSLLHNPCSTTIYTIYKETKSVKWTIISSILPLIMGIIVCFLIAQVWRLFGGLG